MEDVREWLLGRLREAGYEVAEASVRGSGAAAVIIPDEESGLREIDVVLPVPALEEFIRRQRPIVADPDLPLSRRERVVGDVFGMIVEGLHTDRVTAMGVRRRKGSVEWFERRDT